MMQQDTADRIGQNETANQEAHVCVPPCKHKASEYIKRTAMLLIGLAIMSFGVALSIQASLGTSPISGIPYVLNLISGLSVGTTTIIVNVAIVLLQIILLRRRFKSLRLLQIPVCIAFGLLTDLALLCIQAVVPADYPMQWLVCLGGIILVAVGVSCTACTVSAKERQPRRSLWD